LICLCIWLNNFHGQLPPVSHKLPQITAKRQPNPYNEIKIHSQIKRRQDKTGQKQEDKRMGAGQGKVKVNSKQQEQH